jgi:4-amino-4-deoxy-L-arabinose transferase-like glycosyltransferase
LISILLAGAFFRFYGLTIGFPFEFHVDEWFVVNKTLEMYQLGTLKPPAFDYPSLVYYHLLACAHVVGLFKQPTAYDLYVLGRTSSALFATITIALVYMTGKRAYGARAGLLASAFYAFTVTAFREAHYYTTDSMNTFFITLGVYFIVRVALGDATRNYLLAGVAIGLAAGSKYNGAFLLVPLVAAHVLRVYRSADEFKLKDAKPGTFFAKLFSRWLIASALLSFVVFLCTTPYAALTPSEFRRDLGKIGHALSTKIGEGNQHYLGTTPYWYYIENLLYWAQGPLLEAACLLGFLYALARHRRQDVVLLVWLIIYFAVVGGWLNKAVRYTLPMLPFLSLLAAAMFVEAHDYFGARRKRALNVVVVALGGATLAASLLYSLAYLNIYRQPHTGIQATRWAFANIPDGATILLEAPTPQERPPVDGGKMFYDDASFDFGAHRFNFAYLDVPKFSRKDADAQIAGAELRATLARADYIIMSVRWYEGLVNSPEASALIREHYHSLVEGTSDFELAEEVAVYPRLGALEIKDDAAELNFRVFDHPKVWIFRRKGQRQ